MWSMQRGFHGDSCLGYFAFFKSRNLRNLRAESSSLVSTPLAHSGDDEDYEDSVFFASNNFLLLGSPEHAPESPQRTQLRKVLVTSLEMKYCGCVLD